MMLDFDPEVTGFSSQPFWLSWREDGKSRRHAPDYFARMADGTAIVIDVRADDQVPARDAEVFKVTARACASAGWSYRRAGAVDPVLAANVRWLAGYRHPRCLDQARAARLREVFACPAPLLTGARAAGVPLAVLPVLYHLLWTGTLVTDLGPAPLPPEGLLDGLPAAVTDRARWLESHLAEVMSGLPADAGPDTVPRPEYDPAVTSLRQREISKAAELRLAGHEVPLRTFAAAAAQL